MRKGPTAAPLIIMCARTAATALTGMLVPLTNTSIPLPSWFILDAFKWITSTWWDHRWSIVTLPQLRCFFFNESCNYKVLDGDFIWSEGAITHSVFAAHNMMIFWSDDFASQCFVIKPRAAGRRAPGFLKLILCRSSVCVFVCVHVYVCIRAWGY